MSEKDEVSSVHLKSAIDALLNDPGDRNVLKSKTYQRHSFDNRVQDLMKIANDVMSRYTPTKSLLSFD